MRVVTKGEYDVLKTIVKNELIGLAKHEDKNSYLLQFAINNCFAKSRGNSLYYLMYAPGFQRVIENEYAAALKENPECFGTNDAKDVVHALYIQAKKNKYAWREERYTEHLSTEIFCLLLCRKESGFSNKMLRIDLFRHLKKSEENPEHYAFEGGIFHALKHFSINGQCASLFPNQKVSLYDIEQLIWPMAEAFYEGTAHPGKYKNTYETECVYLNKKITLVYYQEEGRKVCFVNSVIPKSL